MKSLLGLRLRELRLNSGITLRKAASEAGIDVAVLSKMERGERKFNKDLVLKLAQLYHSDPESLQVLFISDKVLYELKNEDKAAEAMKMAEQSIRYGLAVEHDLSEIKKICRKAIQKDGRIEKAWIFGSYARNEQVRSSDLDLLISLKKGMAFSLYDLAETQYLLEELTGLRVDLVEVESLSPLMQDSVMSNSILIYG